MRAWALVASCLTALAGRPAAARSPHAVQISALGVQRLEVKLPRGLLRILAKRGTSANVHAEPGIGSEACTVEATRVGTTLQISTGGDAPAAGCELAQTITVPPRLDIDVHSGAGNVFISGSRGTITLDLPQGSAVVGGQIGHLVANMGEGSLSATGLRGDAEISIRQGNVQLWYERMPAPGNIVLNILRGNATVSLPPGPVAVNLDLSHGQLQADGHAVANTATCHIDGSLGQGNLYLR